MTTKTDSRLAWDEVADHLSALGLKLKLHFEQSGADPGAADEMRDAMGKMASAIDGAFAAIGNAVKDEAVRSEITNAAESLADAIGTSLSEGGEELAAAAKGLCKSK